MNNKELKSKRIMRLRIILRLRSVTKSAMTGLIGKTALLLVACCVLFPLWGVGGLFAQTFSGGSGTQADPYKISKPEDLVELYTITNVNAGAATVGQYFEMTNNIDMIGISDFVPIGVTTQNPGSKTHPFCGNFDGKNFAIKNVTIIDTVTSSQQNTALFGDVKGAKITNVILDNASFSYTKSGSLNMAAFVGRSRDSLYMDNCIAINCTLKGGNVSGFIRYTDGKIRISNCHVINATMEGNSIGGFLGRSSSELQITNSSVRYSTLTNKNTIGGFVATFTAGGRLSECYVSNSILSGTSIYGFVYSAGEGEINNCGVQSLLSKTGTSQSSTATGFGNLIGQMAGNPMTVSNCYSACEFASIDNDHTNNYAFCANNAFGGVTVNNSYYKTDAKLGGTNRGDVVEKSETDLKNAAMVSHTNTPNVSLNYNGNTAWKQDLTPPINKGYPILGWQQRYFYVSTYHPTDLGNTFATLQGLTFAEGEGIIAERGFYWQQKGANNWAKIPVQDTTFNISHLLAGLTKDTVYEYCAYMKLFTESSERYGDTVEFTAGEYGEQNIIISGKVTLEGGSSPLAGVSISCSGQPNATTNAQGEFSFVVPSPATVTLVPSLSGYTFTPNNRPLSNVTTDQLNQDFVAKNVGIVGTASTRPIQIYPNPTDGQLRITNYELRENTVIEIFSIVGQVVGAYRIRPEDTEAIIDISHLSNGIYFMKIDGKTVKIVKQ